MSGTAVTVDPGDQPDLFIAPFGKDALEGGGFNSRETALWSPPMGSPDRIINQAKPVSDARGRDVALNDGLIRGAVQLHKDSIVGSNFILMAHPDLKGLQMAPNGGTKAFDEVWQAEFQDFVETRFALLGDSTANWLDAAGYNDFTNLVRMAVGGFVITGEVLAAAQWNRDPLRPYKTCVSMVSPDRLSNPNGRSDTNVLRRGVVKDFYGRAQSYWIRDGYPTDRYTDGSNYTWTNVPARKPWGRSQVIHIIEQLLPDQSRGLAEIVSALKQIKMTRQFNDITLQNAVVNSLYAGAIESDLPSVDIQAAMGSGAAGDPAGGFLGAVGAQLGAMSAYLAAGSVQTSDGVKIPHLFPGTKLNIKTLGTPGGIGTDYEYSLLCKIAATLGWSYEEFTRDFSKSNYSSIRAALSTQGKFIRARKKNVADRFANEVYQLQVEEMWNAGEVPLPRGVDLSFFYQPLMKEALCSASWIGAGTAQIDELKETQGAILRMGAYLTSPTEEIAALSGKRSDKVFGQIARDKKLLESLSLDPPNLSAQRPLTGTGKGGDAVASPAPGALAAIEQVQQMIEESIPV